MFHRPEGRRYDKLTLRSRKTVSPQALADALDVLPLQRDFYLQIRTWMRGLRHDDAAFRGTVPEGDRHEILLRHLIRILFVWILKEDQFLPKELFDPDFAREHGITDYHNDMLRFLFHDRLNAQERDREPHRIPAVDEVFSDVPFLNGSLFAERVGDDRLQIAADRYWRDDEDDSALFNILARYHWTADEHQPGEREQTLDPELLGNLFEQLLADPLIEEKERRRGKETLKAPDGAYYTPMDVAAEMAADALAAAVRDYVPVRVKDEQLLDLFRSPDALPAGLDALSARQRARLQARLQELRIFDPAVGSGQFLLACLQPLRTARRLLDRDETRTTREIITHQLMGQDINPMAAQIARLRLFIALRYDERDSQQRPLPNLEARIICADTLHTHPVPDYDPLARRGTGRQIVLVGGADREKFDRALRTLGGIREEWATDYNESAKRERRDQDRAARADLDDLLQAMLPDGDAKRELRALVDYPLLDLDHDQPAAIDPRLLFAQGQGLRTGFDVVIGNPPYQSFGKSGIGDAERGVLEGRGYCSLRLIVDPLAPCIRATSCVCARPDAWQRQLRASRPLPPEGLRYRERRAELSAQPHHRAEGAGSFRRRPQRDVSHSRPTPIVADAQPLFDVLEEPRSTHRQSRQLSSDAIGRPRSGRMTLVRWSVSDRRRARDAPATCRASSVAGP